MQQPCNSRATEGLETGRIGEERAGLRVLGNPDSIGLFSSGQVRQDRRTTVRIPLGLNFSLCYKGFRDAFRLRATNVQ